MINIYILIFFVSLLIVFLGLYIFNKLGILDKPGPDVPNRKPVPNIQGVFLFIGIFLVVYMFFPEYVFRMDIIALFIGGIIILFFTIIDEFKGIPRIVRLIIQIILGVIAFYIGGVAIGGIRLPDFGYIDFPLYVSLFFTLLWFVFFINAINWFDGIYGLASGISSIGFLTILLLIKFVVIPYYGNIPEDELMKLEMIVNISFIFFVFSLIYTFVEYKPIGLLRDVGVMFLGFSLAYLALLGGAKIGAITVALSLVIFDAIWVFLNRLFVIKKNPLNGDYTHLHHRLMALNWNRDEVRFFIWGWSVFFMILIILQEADRFNKISIFVLMFVVFFSVNTYLFWYKKLPYEYIKKDKK